MRQFTLYLVFLLVLITISWVILPTHYESEYPKLFWPELDEKIKHTYQGGINRLEPELVLLGDSTLVRGVDDIQLGRLLERPVYEIGYRGSASALWYLITKNNIVSSLHKPDYLVIFFRGTMLTTPDFRVSGEYFDFIDDYADQNDTVLVQLAYLNQVNWFQLYSQKHIPLYGEGIEIQDTFSRYAKYPVFYRYLIFDKEVVDEAIISVFDTKKLARHSADAEISAAESFLYLDKNLYFDDQVHQSFLPEIIRLCQDAGIQLILVQMKSQYIPRTIEAQSLFSAYLESLKKYLDENHVPLIDFSEDDRITEDLFLDVVHLTEEGKGVFTPLLADEIATIIE